MAKVLIVEDDQGLQEIYKARLEAEGYDIATATDGEQALAVAVQEKPDVIMLDVMMPKISGFDVLDMLRTTPETKAVKVVLLTALGTEEDRQKGESLGANKYLVKSQITLEDVVAAVSEQMGGSASSDTVGTTAPAEPQEVRDDSAQVSMPVADEASAIPAPVDNTPPATDDTQTMPVADTPAATAAPTQDEQQPPQATT